MSFLNDLQLRFRLTNPIVSGPGQIKIFQPGMEQNQFKDDLLKAAKSTREKISAILSETVFKEGCNTKQEASKRCQALATFMESLMVEINKNDLRVDMPQDADMTISERDSVMLGEISPHHEYYDSKSSSETPPSYNQLNYTENLNRFFESKPEDADKIDNADVPPSTAEEIAGTSGGAGTPIIRSDTDRHSTSPQQRFSSTGTRSAGNFSSGSNLNMGSTTNTSNTGTSSGSYQPPALTESLLNKHNDDMEKLLLKRHREFRATSRSEKNKKNTMQTSLALPEAAPGGYPSTSAISAVVAAQGTKRSGSHSWEGLDHRTSKHQHVGGDNGNMIPPSAQDNVPREPTNLMSVPPMSQIQPNDTNNPRSLFTQGSASSLMRNIELWPPFSVSLTSMRSSALAVQTAPFHPNPGIFRTMYYIPQQQLGHGSEHPGPPPAFPYIMLPHTPMFGQPILYHPTVHPMIYPSVVPVATDNQQSSAPQPQTNTAVYQVRLQW